jgi:hypothetical protein
VSRGRAIRSTRSVDAYLARKLYPFIFKKAYELARKKEKKKKHMNYIFIFNFFNFFLITGDRKGKWSEITTHRTNFKRKR